MADTLTRHLLALDPGASSLVVEVCASIIDATREATLPVAAFVCIAEDSDEVRRLYQSIPSGVPMVILAEDRDDSVLRDGFAKGAVAVLSPNAGSARLCAAVVAVMQGLNAWEADASHARSREFANRAASDPGVDPLTPRELEVFELMAKGLTNREIGAALNISTHTAKFHVAQILEKTGAATRAEAVRLGLRLGLVGI